MVFVTDTHPFLWFLTDDKRLGEEAKKVYDEAETGDAVVVVPTIVLAESSYISAKKNFKLKFDELLDMVENSINFPPYPLDIEIIRMATKLDKLNEIHDKIIVATAQRINAALITKDEEIIKSGYVKTIW
jgi:predicted nucleic acid-binding protein